MVILLKVVYELCDGSDLVLLKICTLVNKFEKSRIIMITYLSFVKLRILRFKEDFRILSDRWCKLLLLFLIEEFANILLLFDGVDSWLLKC